MSFKDFIFFLIALSFSCGTSCSSEDHTGSNTEVKGIILSFHDWPLDEKEKTIILTKAKETGLEENTELPDFKTWIFKWTEWKEGKIALKVCKSFSALPSLESCEPDYLLNPASR